MFPDSVVSQDELKRIQAMKEKDYNHREGSFSLGQNLKEIVALYSSNLDVITFQLVSKISDLFENYGTASTFSANDFSTVLNELKKVVSSEPHLPQQTTTHLAEPSNNDLHLLVPPSIQHYFTETFFLSFNNIKQLSTLIDAAISNPDGPLFQTPDKGKSQGVNQSILKMSLTASIALKNMSYHKEDHSRLLRLGTIFQANVDTTTKIFDELVKLTTDILKPLEQRRKSLSRDETDENQRDDSEKKGSERTPDKRHDTHPGKQKLPRGRKEQRQDGRGGRSQKRKTSNVPPTKSPASTFTETPDVTEPHTPTSNQFFRAPQSPRIPSLSTTDLGVVAFKGLRRVRSISAGPSLRMMYDADRRTEEMEVLEETIINSTLSPLSVKSEDINLLLQLKTTAYISDSSQQQSEMEKRKKKRKRSRSVIPLILHVPLASSSIHIRNPVMLECPPIQYVMCYLAQTYTLKLTRIVDSLRTDQITTRQHTMYRTIRQISLTSALDLAHFFGMETQPIVDAIAPIKKIEVSKPSMWGDLSDQKTSEAMGSCLLKPVRFGIISDATCVNRLAEYSMRLSQSFSTLPSLFSNEMVLVASLLSFPFDSIQPIRNDIESLPTSVSKLLIHFFLDSESDTDRPGQYIQDISIHQAQLLLVSFVSFFVTPAMFDFKRFPLPTSSSFLHLLRSLRLVIHLLSRFRKESMRHNSPRSLSVTLHSSLYPELTEEDEETPPSPEELTKIVSTCLIDSTSSTHFYLLTPNENENKLPLTTPLLRSFQRLEQPSRKGSIRSFPSEIGTMENVSITQNSMETGSPMDQLLNQAVHTFNQVIIKAKRQLRLIIRGYTRSLISDSANTKPDSYFTQKKNINSLTSPSFIERATKIYVLEPSLPFHIDQPSVPYQHSPLNKSDSVPLTHPKIVTAMTMLLHPLFWKILPSPVSQSVGKLSLTNIVNQGYLTFNASIDKKLSGTESLSDQQRPQTGQANSIIADLFTEASQPKTKQSVNDHVFGSAFINHSRRRKKREGSGTAIVDKGSLGRILTRYEKVTASQLDHVSQNAILTSSFSLNPIELVSLFRLRGIIAARKIQRFYRRYRGIQKAAESDRISQYERKASQYVRAILHNSRPPPAVEIQAVMDKELAERIVDKAKWMDSIILFQAVVRRRLVQNDVARQVRAAQTIVAAIRVHISRKVLEKSKEKRRKYQHSISRRTTQMYYRLKSIVDTHYETMAREVLAMNKLHHLVMGFSKLIVYCDQTHTDDTETPQTHSASNTSRDHSTLFTQPVSSVQHKAHLETHQIRSMHLLTTFAQKMRMDVEDVLVQNFDGMMNTFNALYVEMLEWHRDFTVKFLGSQTELNEQIPFFSSKNDLKEVFFVSDEPTRPSRHEIHHSPPVQEVKQRSKATPRLITFSNNKSMTTEDCWKKWMKQNNFVPEPVVVPPEPEVVVEEKKNTFHDALLSYPKTTSAFTGNLVVFDHQHHQSIPPEMISFSALDEHHKSEEGVAFFPKYDAESVYESRPQSSELSVTSQLEPSDPQPKFTEHSLFEPVDEQFDKFEDAQGEEEEEDEEDDDNDMFELDGSKYGQDFGQTGSSIHTDSHRSVKSLDIKDPDEQDEDHHNLPAINIGNMSTVISPIDEEEEGSQGNDDPNLATLFLSPAPSLPRIGFSDITPSGSPHLEESLDPVESAHDLRSLDFDTPSIPASPQTSSAYHDVADIFEGIFRSVWSQIESEDCMSQLELPLVQDDLDEDTLSISNVSDSFFDDDSHGEDDLRIFLDELNMVDHEGDEDFFYRGSARSRRRGGSQITLSHPGINTSSNRSSFVQGMNS
ncbi:hypothetical protein BLNAU_247 [Blattamonas nauphoetae]|uniref:Uncharacterized protein n=1 Tax=Blattamonas nauphoetae TaxID=2049346 RepID=A0ABQ9YMH2_9EUKA|nr:hypothetical protein BLNAU_247 [Blattamonas nauphoetae]